MNRLSRYTDAKGEQPFTSYCQATVLILIIFRIEKIHVGEPSEVKLDLSALKVKWTVKSW